MRFSALQRSTALLLASTALSVPANAQVAAPQMPRSRVLDLNNVDLVTGSYLSPAASLSIGTEGSGIAYGQKLANGQWWISNFSISLQTTATTATVTVGTESKTFNGSGPTYSPADADGSTLAYNSTTQNYTYTFRDGTIITIPNASRRASSIKYGSGEIVSLFYDQNTAAGVIYYRLRSVGTSNGFQVRLTYALASMSNNANNYRAWSTPSTVTAANNTLEACQPSATSCTFTNLWPKLIFSGSLSLTVTEPGGETRYTSTQYSTGNYRVTAIKRASSATDNTVISYDANNRVSQVVTDGRTWTYTYSLVGSQITTTVTGPGSPPRVVVSNVGLGVPLSVQDELGRTTSYTYDINGRLKRITQPEGNYTEFTYDGRGNATQTTRVSKTPGTPPDIVTSATYPATCTSVLTCNKPTTATDARGKVTDFAYDATHGGLLSVTAPAPTVGAVRPQTRFGYTNTQAYFENASGSVVASGVPTWQMTSISACQTLASCSNAANEVKTSINYGPQIAGTANNLFPISTSKGSGDGLLTATTTYTYDTIGNVKFIDGPLTGTNDRTKIDYNDARGVVGKVGPDPDGTGPLLRRAERTTFAADSIIRTEYGTTPVGGPFAWDNFEVKEEIETNYDVSGRKISQTLKSGETAYAVIQYSYDAKGRLECTAQRMNPAAFASLPPSACTVGPQGQFGPDRIKKNVYNSADEVTQVQSAVGTADQASEATFTYTNNGKLQSLKDAENNLTTYVYDGFDRPSETRFPSPTKGAGTSNSGDNEVLTYDANSNVTNRQLRDDANVSFTYDNLNRPTLKNLPGSEPDVTYAYDNLGRLTSASQTGNSLSFTYDALSRNLTQVGPLGTVSSQWDVAGRRTRLTYPGSGLYLDYEYLVTGGMTKIRENGATSGIGVLATFAYDDLGRRTGLTFGNGATQSYTYDPISRLSSLTANLTGTANDLTIGSITYNPAGQIIGQPRSNGAYAWTAHYAENRAYSANGLNQLTASGAIVPTYDARGNLTSAGTTTYGYSAENTLVSATAGTSATLGYDPALRLYQVTAGASTTRFAYDGLDQIAEFNASGGLLRRHVFGPNTDEPLVWYEGSGTTDRRFLSADERGSVIAVSDAGGNLLTTNSYDEYGIPGTANAGRFQFTGQAWLPELGMYHYKARIYSPTLGRFLQTDPIDIAGGINLYAYVKNDPVNWTDPNGQVANFIVGGLIGGAFSYATQVGQNFANGQTGSAAFTNVSWGQVALSASVGALSGGFAFAAVTGTARFAPLASPIALNMGERGVLAALAVIGPATKATVNWGTVRRGGSAPLPTITGAFRLAVNLAGLATLDPSIEFTGRAYIVDANGNIVLDANGNLIEINPYTGEIIYEEDEDDGD